MKNINAMYAHLQKTSWTQYANTTLGHLPVDQFKLIESAYEAQIAAEAAQETPTTNTPTPDVEFPTGDSMNSACGVETPSDVGATSDGPESGINQDVSGPSSSDVADQAAPVAGQFGENDENEVGQP